MVNIKRLFSVIICSVMLCIMFIPTTAVAAPTAPTIGDGVRTPYEISLPGHLEWLAANSSQWDKDYIQTAQIDMSGVPFTTIGTDGTRFTGSYDGQDYEIANLTVNMPGNFVGMFGYTENATLTGVQLVDVSITGTAVSGGLVGQGTNTTITNCHTSGSVTITYEFVGGLIGFNKGGTISNCTSSCTVAAVNMTMPDDSQKPRIVGGFVGKNTHNGTINNCSATGDVSAAGNFSGTIYGDYVGGFCGDNGMYDSNDPGFITGCFATGEVFAARSVAGGFIGRCMHMGNVTSCYATGDVTADGNDGGAFAGGFVGITMCKDNTTMTPSVISECYATGDVTTTVGSYAGGFVGRNQDSNIIEKSYATGYASSGKSAVGGFAGGNTSYDNAFSAQIIECYSTGNADAAGGYAGGFIGYNDGDISKSYSVGDTSGLGGYAGGFCAVHSDGTISDCYAIGNASTSDKYGGGFVGASWSLIRDCYSIGVPSATDATRFGGFSGYTDDADGTLENCFYDVITATVPENTGYIDGTAKTTAEMQVATTFSAWDLVNIWHVYDYQYPQFRRFISGDMTSPVMDSLSPADDETNVDRISDLVITFFEKVNAETGSIVLYDASGVIETIDVTGAKVTGDGTTTITVNLDTTLSYETEYYVLIDATAFNDTSDNSYAGIADITAWTFTTGAEPAPTPSPTPTETPLPSDTQYGSITTVVTDASGNTLAGYTVELHSTVVTAVTDSNGKVTFTNVPLVDHTLVVLDASSAEIGRVQLDMQKGSASTSVISGNQVDIEFSENTVSVEVNVKVEGGSSGITVDEVTINENPNTGGTAQGFNLWWVVVILAVLVAATTGFILLQSKRIKS